MTDNAVCKTSFPRSVKYIQSLAKDQSFPEEEEEDKGVQTTVSLRLDLKVGKRYNLSAAGEKLTSLNRKAV